MLSSRVPRSVDADVRHGVVTLTGTAQWQYQRDEAEHVASRIRGASGLVDEIVISNPVPTVEDLEDSIDAAFRRNAALEARDLSLVTSNGTVTVTGAVGSRAGRDAAIAALGGAGCHRRQGRAPRGVPGADLLTTNALRLAPRRLRRPRIAFRRHRRSVDPALPLLRWRCGGTVADRHGGTPGQTRRPRRPLGAGDHLASPRGDRPCRRTHAFVPVAAIIALKTDGVEVAGVLSRRPVPTHEWLVALAKGVLDRQLVDVDGVDVVRVSDLVLGDGPDGFRLVGFDVSVRTMLRRTVRAVRPPRSRARATSTRSAPSRAPGDRGAGAPLRRRRRQIPPAHRPSLPWRGSPARGC